MWRDRGMDRQGRGGMREWQGGSSVRDRGYFSYEFGILRFENLIFFLGELEDFYG